MTQPEQMRQVTGAHETAITETRARKTNQSAATSAEIKSKPISERKRQANRKNAQRSTGPKSETGKNWSRSNALKHGFFIKKMPLERCQGSENENDARRLAQEFFDHCQPVGPLERMQVEIIVQCCWKMRRLNCAENASIKLQIELESEEILRQRNQGGQGGLQSLSHLLDDAKKEAEALGYIDDTLVDTILKTSRVETYFKTELLLANQKARELATAPNDSPKLVANSAMKRVRSSLRASLEAFDDRQAVMEDWADQWETERQLPHYDQHLIPPSLDNLLRYQVALERSYYRAVAELERLQRRRLGESAGEPLKLMM